MNGFVGTHNLDCLHYWGGCCNGGYGTKGFNLGSFGSGKVSQTKGYNGVRLILIIIEKLVFDVFIHFSLPHPSYEIPIWSRLIFFFFSVNRGGNRLDLLSLWDKV